MIVAHAHRARPDECCGLLLGRDGEILEAVPTRNTASDPTRRYAIDPVEHFAQIHRCRRINDRQGEHFAVVGAYHSHPARGAEPSTDDHAESFSDFVFLIVGFVDGGGVDVAAYTRSLDGLIARPLVVS